MEMDDSKPSSGFRPALFLSFFLLDQRFNFLPFFFRHQGFVAFLEGFSQHAFDGTVLPVQHIFQRGQSVLVNI